MTAEPVSETATGTLSVHRHGPVAWVLLDRPEQRNAFSPAMWSALPALLEDLDADPSVRLVGPGVVSGLAERSQLSVQAHEHLIRETRSADTAAVGLGADEVSEALFRQVVDGPDARIGQRAFLTGQKPSFERSGEDFWGRWSRPLGPGGRHRPWIAGGRRSRRPA